MTAQQRQKPFCQAPSETFASLQSLMSVPGLGLRQEQPNSELEEPWQGRLRILQQWICELLSKNQQLRMLLEAALATERED
jgi:hypothetical protein